MASLLMKIGDIMLSEMQCCNSDRPCQTSSCMGWRNETNLVVDSEGKRTENTGKGWCLMVPDIQYDK